MHFSMTISANFEYLYHYKRYVKFGGTGGECLPSLAHESGSSPPGFGKFFEIP